MTGHTRWLPLLVLVVVSCTVVAFATPRFGSTYNMFVILQAAAVDALVGLAQLCVLAVGDLSLAVGGIGALVTVLAGNCFQVHHWPATATIVMALALGTACGFVNGLLIGRSGLSGFIITLATGSVFTGIAYGITNGLPYASVPSVLASVGQDRVSFLPYVLVLTLVISAGVATWLRWLPAGRELLAVGGNRDAATLAGLSRQRAVIIAHSASGFLAAVAALMYMGILQSATPATGSDWLITSFAVPIIGGTALTGGEAPAFGCFVAGLVLAAINNVLIVLNIDTNAVEMAEGLLIFAAVWLARFSGKRKPSSPGRRTSLPALAPSASSGRSSQEGTPVRAGVP